MDIPAILRSNIALADRLTKSVQVPVTRHAWTSQSVKGDGSFTDSTLYVFWEQKEQVILSNGVEVAVRHTISVTQQVHFDPKDEITLPDGKRGPIMISDGFPDAGTGSPFYAVVYMG